MKEIAHKFLSTNPTNMFMPSFSLSFCVSLLESSCMEDSILCSNLGCLLSWPSAYHSSWKFPWIFFLDLVLFLGFHVFLLLLYSDILVELIHLVQRVSSILPGKLAPFSVPALSLVYPNLWLFFPSCIDSTCLSDFHF